MIDPRYSPFEQFLIDRDKDIRRIAGRTRSEITAEDVRNEAWIFAVELSQTGNIAAEIVNLEFQEKVLSHLFQYFVRYTEHNVRNAVRLDQQAYEDGPADRYDLLDHLSAGGLSDPLSLLLAWESAPSGSGEPDPLHTQAGAYYHLLGRHDGKITTLAEYLQISASHCYRCYGRVRQLAEAQWSMAFAPAANATEPPLKPWRKFRVVRAPRQLDFRFHEWALW